MGRHKNTYDVYERDTCIMTGQIEEVCAFLGKKENYIRQAVKECRQVNRRYTVISRGEPEKAYPNKRRIPSRYVLWNADNFIGIFGAGEIARCCGVTQAKVAASARNGQEFSGHYTVLNFNRFAEEWNAIRRKWGYT